MLAYFFKGSGLVGEKSKNAFSDLLLSKVPTLFNQPIMLRSFILCKAHYVAKKICQLLGT